MKLMTKELEKKLLKNAGIENTEDFDDSKPIVHFFTPYSGKFDWYISSAEKVGDDLHMFGYVINNTEPLFSEYGYISLSELENAKIGKLQLVEREYNECNYTFKELEKMNIERLN